MSALGISRSDVSFQNLWKFIKKTDKPWYWRRTGRSPTSARTWDIVTVRHVSAKLYSLVAPSVNEGEELETRCADLQVWCTVRKAKSSLGNLSTADAVLLRVMYLCRADPAIQSKSLKYPSTIPPRMLKWWKRQEWWSINKNDHAVTPRQGGGKPRGQLCQQAEFRRDLPHERHVAISCKTLLLLI